MTKQTFDKSAIPNQNGRFGDYGGKFVPETLMPALEELESAYKNAVADSQFNADFAGLCTTYSGRPTPIYHAANLSSAIGGAQIFLKREDLAHTGAHKINNAVGQGLLAKRMGKNRIIAETGAGQHGVATATVCAMLSQECIVYMGEEDIFNMCDAQPRMYCLHGRRRYIQTVFKCIQDEITRSGSCFCDRRFKNTKRCN